MRYIFIILAFMSFIGNAQNKKHLTYSHGAIVRGDSNKKHLALVFTADEYGEGLKTIIQTLKKQKVKAGFFFTGRFYSNKSFKQSIQKLKKNGHYLGPHSNAHLLYCDWIKRDSLLVTKDSFEKDLALNLRAMKTVGLPVDYPLYFIPPFEWWNDSIAFWSKEQNLSIINFTPGLRTTADYTWPELPNYKSSEWIINWLKEYIPQSPKAFNGAILLLHAGTDPRRKDKLYHRLDEFISILKKEGYQFLRIDNLLKTSANN